MINNYSIFEIKMMSIFQELYGGSTESVESQAWWKDIQKLKKLAQDEMKEEEIIKEKNE